MGSDECASWLYASWWVELSPNSRCGLEKGAQERARGSERHLGRSKASLGSRAYGGAHRTSIAAYWAVFVTIQVVCATCHMSPYPRVLCRATCHVPLPVGTAFHEICDTLVALLAPCRYLRATCHVSPIPTRPSLPRVPRRTAFHEAGHALVALLTPGASPIHKATIVPRGHALGMVTQVRVGACVLRGVG